jgi:hypothetical protein
MGSEVVMALYTIETVQLTVCLHDTKDEKLLAPMRVMRTIVENGALVAVVEESEPGLAGPKYRTTVQAWPLTSIRWWRQQTEGH